MTDAGGAHFFAANSEFKSGFRPVDPFPPQPRAERIMNGEVLWQEMYVPDKPSGAKGHGSTSPPAKSSLWMAQKHYDAGAVVCVQRNGMKDQIAESTGYEINARVFKVQEATLDLRTQGVSLEDALQRVQRDLAPACQKEKELLDKAAALIAKVEHSSKESHANSFIGMSKDLEAKAEGLQRQSSDALLHQASDLEEKARRLNTPDPKDPNIQAQQAVASFTEQALEPLQKAAKQLRTAAPLAAGVRAELLDEPAQLLNHAAIVLRQAAALLSEGAPHLHYYLAVKGGESGLPAPDPLSVVMIPRAIQGFTIVGRSRSLTFSPGRTRKSFELIFIFVPFRNVRRVVRIFSFMGLPLPNLPLRLLPVLNGSPVLAASLLV